MKNPTKKQPLVLMSAKVPADIQTIIQSHAIAEDRTLSQIISRLLASHPVIKSALRQNRAAHSATNGK